MKQVFSKFGGHVKRAIRAVTPPRSHAHVPHSRPRWRMRRHHVGTAALMVGGTAAAILFLVIGLTIRLLIGPISLGPFASAIEDTLNASVSGLVVHFDRAMLEWSQSEGRVNLTILGAKVFDSHGHIVAQAPKAELDFNAGALLAGRTELKRFALIGVQLTAVRNQQGEIKLGFRSNQGESDLLKAISDALQYNGQTVAAWGRARNRLDRFDILNARLAFHDEPTGLFLVSPSASLTVKSNGDLLDASLDAAVEVSGVRATIVAEAEMTSDGVPRHGALEVHGLSLTALAANSPAFAGLAPFGLTLDLTGNVDLNADGTVKTLDFGVSGNGVAGRPHVDPVAIGIGNFHMLGRFDGATRRIMLDDITIEGDALRAKGTGHLDVGWEQGTLTSLAGELNVENVAFNVPDRFAAPVAFERMALRGSYDRVAGKITVDNAVMSAGPLQANLVGTATLAGEQSPALDVKGTVNPIALRDFLHYWPVGLAEGARSWIQTNISQGHIGQMAIDAHIPAGALDQPFLPDDALSFSFPFTGVNAQYIKGMTQLTAAQGAAHLSGDTFRAEVTRGNVGPLAVSHGVVVIPGLHLADAVGTIDTHVEGKVPDVLMLIDEQPLGYPHRFHVDPKQTSGEAALDLEFTVPMLKNLNVDQLGIGIKAKTTNLSLPVGETHRLDEADLAFAIDGKSLVAEGPVKVNGVALNMKWTEDFAPAAGVTTHIDVQGTLDDAARVKLGLPDAGAVFGPSSIALALTGHRFQFSNGALKADLRDASLDIPAANIEKPAGQPATLTANIRFSGGAVSISDMVVTGSGLDIRGGLDLDSANNLLNVAFPTVRAGPNDDFSLAVKPGEGGGYAIHIEGRSFDASHIFASRSKTPPKPDENTQMKEPLSVSAKFDKVLFKEGVTLSGFTLSAALGANERVQGFALDAIEPNKERVTGAFSQQPDGTREITFEAGDASPMIRGLTGFTGLRKGTLTAHAKFGGESVKTDSPIDYQGGISIHDVVLADQPFSERAAQPPGTTNVPAPTPPLAAQGGTEFTKVEATFAARGKMITITDGRGAGPSSGLSFEGEIDRRAGTVAISGTLVPMYGINSMLGAVPLVGDVLVSKKGEGVFGITYAVRGDIDKPDFVTNPLSVLTPGIFRRIFEYGNTLPQPKPVASAAGNNVPPAAPDTPTQIAAPGPAQVDVTPLAVPVPKPKPQAMP